MKAVTQVEDAVVAQLKAEAEAWLSRWQELGERIEAGACGPRPCVEIVLEERR